eukprot:gene13481-9289_t
MPTTAPSLTGAGESPSLDRLETLLRQYGVHPGRSARCCGLQLRRDPEALGKIVLAACCALAMENGHEEGEPKQHARLRRKRQRQTNVSDPTAATHEQLQQQAYSPAALGSPPGRLSNTSSRGDVTAARTGVEALLDGEVEQRQLALVRISSDGALMRPRSVNNGRHINNDTSDLPPMNAERQRHRSPSGGNEVRRPMDAGTFGSDPPFEHESQPVGTGQVAGVGSTRYWRAIHLARAALSCTAQLSSGEMETETLGDLIRVRRVKWRRRAPFPPSPHSAGVRASSIGEQEERGTTTTSTMDLRDINRMLDVAFNENMINSLRNTIQSLLLDEEVEMGTDRNETEMVEVLTDSEEEEEVVEEGERITQRLPSPDHRHHRHDVDVDDGIEETILLEGDNKKSVPEKDEGGAGAASPSSSSVAELTAQGAQTVCGRHYGRLEFVVHCASCSRSESSIMCFQCYWNSPCRQHKVWHKACTSGMCDCGDVEALVPEAFCREHRQESVGEAEEDDRDVEATAGALPQSGAIRAIAPWQKGVLRPWRAALLGDGGYMRHLPLRDRDWVSAVLRAEVQFIAARLLRMVRRGVDNAVAATAQKEEGGGGGGGGAGQHETPQRERHSNGKLHRTPLCWTPASCLTGELLSPYLQPVFPCDLLPLVQHLCEVTRCGGSVARHGVALALAEPWWPAAADGTAAGLVPPDASFLPIDWAEHHGIDSEVARHGPSCALEALLLTYQLFGKKITSTQLYVDDASTNNSEGNDGNSPEARAREQRRNRRRERHRMVRAALLAIMATTSFLCSRKTGEGVAAAPATAALPRPRPTAGRTPTRAINSANESRIGLQRMPFASSNPPTSGWSLLAHGVMECLSNNVFRLAYSTLVMKYVHQVPLRMDTLGNIQAMGNHRIGLHLSAATAMPYREEGPGGWRDPTDTQLHRYLSGMLFGITYSPAAAAKAAWRGKSAITETHAYEKRTKEKKGSTTGQPQAAQAECVAEASREVKELIMKEVEEGDDAAAAAADAAEEPHKEEKRKDEEEWRRVEGRIQLLKRPVTLQLRDELQYRFLPSYGHPLHPLPPSIRFQMDDKALNFCLREAGQLISLSTSTTRETALTGGTSRTALRALCVLVGYLERGLAISATLRGSVNSHHLPSKIIGLTYLIYDGLRNISGAVRDLFDVRRHADKGRTPSEGRTDTEPHQIHKEDPTGHAKKDKDAQDGGRRLSEHLDKIAVKLTSGPWIEGLSKSRELDAVHCPSPYSPAFAFLRRMMKLGADETPLLGLTRAATDTPQWVFSSAEMYMTEFFSELWRWMLQHYTLLLKHRFAPSVTEWLQRIDPIVRGDGDVEEEMEALLTATHLAPVLLPARTNTPSSSSAAVFAYDIRRGGCAHPLVPLSFFPIFLVDNLLWWLVARAEEEERNGKDDDEYPNPFWRLSFREWDDITVQTSMKTAFPPAIPFLSTKPRAELDLLFDAVAVKFVWATQVDAGEWRGLCTQLEVKNAWAQGEEELMLLQILSAVYPAEDFSIRLFERFCQQTYQKKKKTETEAPPSSDQTAAQEVQRQGFLWLVGAVLLNEFSSGFFTEGRAAHWRTIVANTLSSGPQKRSALHEELERHADYYGLNVLEEDRDVGHAAAVEAVACPAGGTSSYWCVKSLEAWEEWVQPYHLSLRNRDLEKTFDAYCSLVNRDAEARRSAAAARQHEAQQEGAEEREKEGGASVLRLREARVPPVAFRCALEVSTTPSWRSCARDLLHTPAVLQMCLFEVTRFAIEMREWEAAERERAAAERTRSTRVSPPHQVGEEEVEKGKSASPASACSTPPDEDETAGEQLGDTRSRDEDERRSEQRAATRLAPQDLNGFIQFLRHFLNHGDRNMNGDEPSDTKEPLRQPQPTPAFLHGVQLLYLCVKDAALLSKTLHNKDRRRAGERVVPPEDGDNAVDWGRVSAYLAAHVWSEGTYALEGVADLLPLEMYSLVQVQPTSTDTSPLMEAETKTPKDVVETDVKEAAPKVWRSLSKEASPDDVLHCTLADMLTRYIPDTSSSSKGAGGSGPPPPLRAMRDLLRDLYAYFCRHPDKDRFSFAVMLHAILQATGGVHDDIQDAEEQHNTHTNAKHVPSGGWEKDEDGVRSTLDWIHSRTAEGAPPPPPHHNVLEEEGRRERLKRRQAELLRKFRSRKGITNDAGPASEAAGDDEARGASVKASRLERELGPCALRARCIDFLVHGMSSLECCVCRLPTPETVLLLVGGRPSNVLSVMGHRVPGRRCCNRHGAVEGGEGDHEEEKSQSRAPETTPRARGGAGRHTQLHSCGHAVHRTCWDRFLGTHGGAGSRSTAAHFCPGCRSSWNIAVPLPQKYQDMPTAIEAGEDLGNEETTAHRDADPGARLLSWRNPRRPAATNAEEDSGSAFVLPALRELLVRRSGPGSPRALLQQAGCTSCLAEVLRAGGWMRMAPAAAQQRGDNGGGGARIRAAGEMDATPSLLGATEPSASPAGSSTNPESDVQDAMCRAEWAEGIRAVVANLQLELELVKLGGRIRVVQLQMIISLLVALSAQREAMQRHAAALRAEFARGEELFALLILAVLLEDDEDDDGCCCCPSPRHPRDEDPPEGGKTWRWTAATHIAFYAARLLSPLPSPHEEEEEGGGTKKNRKDGVVYRTVLDALALVEQRATALRSPGSSRRGNAVAAGEEGAEATAGSTTASSISGPLVALWGSLGCLTLLRLLLIPSGADPLATLVADATNLLLPSPLEAGATAAASTSEVLVLSILWPSTRVAHDVLTRAAAADLHFCALQHEGLSGLDAAPLAAAVVRMIAFLLPPPPLSYGASDTTLPSTDGVFAAVQRRLEWWAATDSGSGAPKRCHSTPSQRWPTPFLLLPVVDPLKAPVEEMGGAALLRTSTPPSGGEAPMPPPFLSSATGRFGPQAWCWHVVHDLLHLPLAYENLIAGLYSRLPAWKGQVRHTRYPQISPGFALLGGGETEVTETMLPLQCLHCTEWIEDGAGLRCIVHGSSETLFYAEEVVGEHARRCTGGLCLYMQIHLNLLVIVDAVRGKVVSTTPAPYLNEYKEQPLQLLQGSLSYDPSQGEALARRWVRQEPTTMIRIYEMEVPQSCLWGRAGEEEEGVLSLFPSDSPHNKYIYTPLIYFTIIVLYNIYIYFCTTTTMTMTTLRFFVSVVSLMKRTEDLWFFSPPLRMPDEGTYHVSSGSEWCYPVAGREKGKRYIVERKSSVFFALKANALRKGHIARDERGGWKTNHRRRAPFSMWIRDAPYEWFVEAPTMLRARLMHPRDHYQDKVDSLKDVLLNVPTPENDDGQRNKNHNLLKDCEEKVPYFWWLLSLLLCVDIVSDEHEPHMKKVVIYTPALCLEKTSVEGFTLPEDKSLWRRLNSISNALTEEEQDERIEELRRLNVPLPILTAVDVHLEKRGKSKRVANLKHPDRKKVPVSDHDEDEVLPIRLSESGQRPLQAATTCFLPSSLPPPNDVAIPIRLLVARRQLTDSSSPSLNIYKHQKKKKKHNNNNKKQQQKKSPTCSLSNELYPRDEKTVVSTAPTQRMKCIEWGGESYTVLLPSSSFLFFSSSSSSSFFFLCTVRFRWWCGELATRPPLPPPICSTDAGAVCMEMALPTAKRKVSGPPAGAAAPRDLYGHSQIATTYTLNSFSTAVRSALVRVRRHHHHLLYQKPADDSRWEGTGSNTDDDDDEGPTSTLEMDLVALLHALCRGGGRTIGPETPSRGQTQTKAAPPVPLPQRSANNRLHPLLSIAVLRTLGPTTSTAANTPGGRRPCCPPRMDAMTWWSEYGRRRQLQVHWQERRLPSTAQTHEKGRLGPAEGFAMHSERALEAEALHVPWNTPPLHHPAPALPPHDEERGEGQADDDDGQQLYAVKEDLRAPAMHAVLQPLMGLLGVFTPSTTYCSCAAARSRRLTCRDALFQVVQPPHPQIVPHLDVVFEWLWALEREETEGEEQEVASNNTASRRRALPAELRLENWGTAYVHHVLDASTPAPGPADAGERVVADPPPPPALDLSVVTPMLLQKLVLPALAQAQQQQAHSHHRTTRAESNVDEQAGALSSTWAIDSRRRRRMGSRDAAVDEAVWSLVGQELMERWLSSCMPTPIACPAQEECSSTDPRQPPPPAVLPKRRLLRLPVEMSQPLWWKRFTAAPAAPQMAAAAASPYHPLLFSPVLRRALRGAGSLPPLQRDLVAVAPVVITSLEAWRRFLVDLSAAPRLHRVNGNGKTETGVPCEMGEDYVVYVDPILEAITATARPQSPRGEEGRVAIAAKEESGPRPQKEKEEEDDVVDSLDRFHRDPRLGLILPLLRFFTALPTRAYDAHGGAPAVKKTKVAKEILTEQDHRLIPARPAVRLPLTALIRVLGESVSSLQQLAGHTARCTLLAPTTYRLDATTGCWEPLLPHTHTQPSSHTHPEGSDADPSRVRQVYPQEAFALMAHSPRVHAVKRLADALHTLLREYETLTFTPPPSLEHAEAAPEGTRTPRSSSPASSKKNTAGDEALVSALEWYYFPPAGASAASVPPRERVDVRPSLHSAVAHVQEGETGRPATAQHCEALSATWLGVERDPGGTLSSLKATVWQCRGVARWLVRRLMQEKQRSVEQDHFLSTMRTADSRPSTRPSIGVGLVSGYRTVLEAGYAAGRWTAAGKEPPTAQPPPPPSEAATQTRATVSNTAASTEASVEDTSARPAMEIPTTRDRPIAEGAVSIRAGPSSARLVGDKEVAANAATRGAVAEANSRDRAAHEKEFHPFVLHATKDAEDEGVRLLRNAAYRLIEPALQQFYTMEDALDGHPAQEHLPGVLPSPCHTTPGGGGGECSERRIHQNKMEEGRIFPSSSMGMMAARAQRGHHLRYHHCWYDSVDGQTAADQLSELVERLGDLLGCHPSESGAMGRTCVAAGSPSASVHGGGFVVWREVRQLIAAPLTAPLGRVLEGVRLAAVQGLVFSIYLSWGGRGAEAEGKPSGSHEARPSPWRCSREAEEEEDALQANKEAMERALSPFRRLVAAVPPAYVLRDVADAALCASHRTVMRRTDSKEEDEWNDENKFNPNIGASIVEEQQMVDGAVFKLVLLVLLLYRQHAALVLAAAPPRVGGGFGDYGPSSREEAMGGADHRCASLLQALQHFVPAETWNTIPITLPDAFSSLGIGELLCDGSQYRFHRRRPPPLPLEKDQPGTHVTTEEPTYRIFSPPASVGMLYGSDSSYAAFIEGLLELLGDPHTPRERDDKSGTAPAGSFATEQAAEHVRGGRTCYWISSVGAIQTAVELCDAVLKEEEEREAAAAAAVRSPPSPPSPPPVLLFLLPWSTLAERLGPLRLYDEGHHSHRRRDAIDVHLQKLFRYACREHKEDEGRGGARSHRIVVAIRLVSLQEEMNFLLPAVHEWKMEAVTAPGPSSDATRTMTCWCLALCPELSLISVGRYPSPALRAAQWQRLREEKEGGRRDGPRVDGSSMPDAEGEDDFIQKQTHLLTSHLYIYIYIYLESLRLKKTPLQTEPDVGESDGLRMP